MKTATVTVTAPDGTTIQTWEVGAKDLDSLRYRAGLAEEIATAVRFAHTAHGERPVAAARAWTRCPDCGQPRCGPLCKGVA